MQEGILIEIIGDLGGNEKEIWKDGFSFLLFSFSQEYFKYNLLP